MPLRQDEISEVEALVEAITRKIAKDTSSAIEALARKIVKEEISSAVMALEEKFKKKEQGKPNEKVPVQIKSDKKEVK